MRYVAYASASLDGIASAAILMRWARLSNRQLRIAKLAPLNKISQAFDDMALQNGSIFFLLDIPPVVEGLQPRLGEITSRNRIAYWSCHFGYRAALRELAEQHVLELDWSRPPTGICSAQLAAKRFLPKDHIALQLAEIAADVKLFQRKDPRAEKLSAVLSAGYSPRELADLLSRGIFWSDRMQTTQDDLKRKRETALRDLLKRVIKKDVLSHSVAYSLAEDALPGAEAGHALLIKTQAEIAIVLYRDGRVFLRRKEGSGLDMARLAKAFDGYGHPWAAAGSITLPTRFTAEKFAEQLWQVERKLKEALIS